jgi:hypothetical protein
VNRQVPEEQGDGKKKCLHQKLVYWWQKYNQMI